ncbi:hypothetical protein KEM48_006498 [Puccinia striiformis f. sp. tritici PST-130]|nr:hypothetical protein KEM48_006498 [Puccinia striiformis f. sp. tritici PST-130]
MLWICRSTGAMKRELVFIVMRCNLSTVEHRCVLSVSRELLAPKHDISSVVYILYLTHVEGVRTAVVDMAPKLQKLTRNLPTTVD